MKMSHRLALVLAALCLVPTGPGNASEELPVDPGGCPTVDVWALPWGAIDSDLPGSTHVPLIPSPEVLECPIVADCGVHFQEVFAAPLAAQVAVLTSLSFRLDVTTPAETLPGDLCWSVTVSLAPYAGEVDDVSPVFSDNLDAAAVQVFDGPLCLVSAAEPAAANVGNELQIVFVEPYVYNAAEGSLLIDVAVDGVIGSPQGFVLDAADDEDAATVVAFDGADAGAGLLIEGGPIVIFEGVPGEVLPGLPWDCVSTLNAPAWVVERLLSYLDAAAVASDLGNEHLVDARMRQYFRTVEHCDRRGVISTAVADRARELGKEAGAAYLAPFAVEDGFRTLAEGSLFLTLVNLSELVGPMFPENSRASEALEDVEGALDEILLDGEIDDADAEAIDAWWDAMQRLVRHGWRYLTGEARSLVQDLWQWLREAREALDDPMVQLYLRFLRLIADGTITQDEAAELIELQRELGELTEDQPVDELGKWLNEAIRILGELASRLQSGDIEAIQIEQRTDGSWLIFIKTTDGFYLKLHEEEYEDGYIISYWVWIENAAFVLRPTPEGHEIEVVPFVDDEGNETYTVELNLDANSWFLILGLESTFDLDLDEITIKKVTFTEDGIVLEGLSDAGEEVLIEYTNGSFRVVVGGRQTYP